MKGEALITATAYREQGYKPKFQEYLFIYSLFNGTVNSSDYTVSNIRMSSE
jgi:hypothetical protein